MPIEFTLSSMIRRAAALSVVAGAASIPTFAQSDLLSDLDRCGNIQDEAASKACFASITGGGAGALPPPPADGPAPAPGSKPVAAPTPAAGKKKAKPARATVDEVKAAAAAVNRSKDAGSWTADYEVSAITDTVNVFLSLLSTDEIPARYGGRGHATLIIRCMDNRTDLLVLMAGHWFYDDHHVVYRIDKEAARRVWWSGSTDNAAAFAPEPIALARELSGAAKLVFQTAPVNEPLYEATFDLAGTKAALVPVQMACNWK